VTKPTFTRAIEMLQRLGDCVAFQPASPLHRRPPEDGRGGRSLIGPSCAGFPLDVAARQADVLEHVIAQAPKTPALGALFQPLRQKDCETPN
jgi:hypothetical protein